MRSEMKRFLLIVIIFSAFLTTTCAKSSRKVEVDGSTEEVVVDPNLPHDFPADLVPPNATYTHGSTGMMKAEENPEGNAWFETSAKVDEIIQFFEDLEGWVLEGKEKKTSEYGEHWKFTVRETDEGSTLEARVELTPFADDEANLYTQIHVAYRGHEVLKLDLKE